MKNLIGILLVCVMGSFIGCKSNQTAAGDMKGPDVSAIAAFAKQLGLEKKVASTFVSIVEKYDKKFMGVHNKPKAGDQNKTLQKAMELRKAQSKELGAILSPEQMEMFSTWRQEQQRKKMEAKNSKG